VLQPYGDILSLVRSAQVVFSLLYRQLLVFARGKAKLCVRKESLNDLYTDSRRDDYEM